MEDFKLFVPTYNGKWLDEPKWTVPEFDDPEVPVLVHQADGVRIVLGTHDYDDCQKPDIQIERRHNGWMIFLHPGGGGDASGFVVFLDDGRSFIAKESGYGPTEPIEMVAYDEAVAELDDLLPSGLSCTPAMVVQKGPVDDTPASDQHAPICDSPSPPVANPKLFISQRVVDALESAQEALAGDSNDDEHAALWALVEALDVYQLGEFRVYRPDWIVSDFCGWAGLDAGEPPDQRDMETYVREARPADSSPLDVNRVLQEWADAVPKMPAEPGP